jgi:hypothetical protein
MRVTLLLWLLYQASNAAPSSQQHPITKPEPSQQQPKDDRRGTQDSPLVVKVLDPEDAEERAAQAAQEREQEAALNRDLVQLTGILALIAGVTAALVVGQLYMMWLGIVTTRRQLRAYVSVSGGKILHEKRPDGWWLEWHPEITNVGQTPAYNVRVATRADIKPDPLPPSTDLMKELESESSQGSRVTKARSGGSMGVGQTVWQHLDLNRSFRCGTERTEEQVVEIGVLHLGTYHLS